MHFTYPPMRMGVPNLPPYPILRLKSLTTSRYNQLFTPNSLHLVIDLLLCSLGVCLRILNRTIPDFLDIWRNMNLFLWLLESKKEIVLKTKLPRRILTVLGAQRERV